MMNDFFREKLSSHLPFHHQAMNTIAFYPASTPDFEVRVSPTKEYRAAIHVWQVRPTFNQILNILRQWLRRGHGSQWTNSLPAFELPPMLLAIPTAQMWALTLGDRAQPRGSFPALSICKDWVEFNALHFLAVMRITQSASMNWAMASSKTAFLAVVKFFMSPSLVIVAPAVTPCLCEILALGSLAPFHKVSVYGASTGVKGEGRDSNR